MGDFLFGSPPDVDMKNTLTPEQQKVLASLNTSLLNVLFNPGGGAGTSSGVTPTTGAAGAGSVTPTASAGRKIVGYDQDGRPLWSNSTSSAAVAAGATPWAQPSPLADHGTTLAGAPVYEGDMTAGPSSIQNMIFSQIPGLLGGIGGDKTVNSALDSFLNKYKGGYSAKSFDPTSTLKMFQESIFDPAMKGYKEETLPQIAELFAGRGSFDSGGTLHTMTESAEDLMGSLMGTKASMLDSAKNAWDNMEMNKFLGINSMIPGVAGAKTSNVSAGLAGLPYAMAAGDTQQGLNQLDINELMYKWTQGQPYNNPYLNILQMALGTPAITPVVNGGSTGFLDAMAPGIGMAGGAKLMSMLAS